MLYIPFKQALDTLNDILRAAGFSLENAALLADVFARNTLEGVASHGLNRFPRFMNSVKTGDVAVDALPETMGALGGLEVWDGHLCAGPVAATRAMARACKLATEHGIACVAVRNSNHWQRAGRYAWQAVREKKIGLCWTNTSQNMPAWGALDAQLGNNPMAFGVPREKGPVVVDISMSQFAYGKLEIASQNHQRLPALGGFDREGRLTDDPDEILATQRVLPIGMWKGAALSLVLDMIASGVALGRTAHQIGPATAGEMGLTQMFIAIHYAGVVSEAAAQARFDDAVEALLSSAPADPAAPLRYPSQQIRETVGRNMEKGLPVNEGTWEKIEALAKQA